MNTSLGHDNEFWGKGGVLPPEIHCNPATVPYFFWSCVGVQHMPSSLYRAKHTNVLGINTYINTSGCDCCRNVLLFSNN